MPSHLTVWVQSVLELRELEERLRQQLYADHEILESNETLNIIPDHDNSDTLAEVIQGWMEHVRNTIAPL